MSDIINVSANLRIIIDQDEDPMSPREWDNLGEIAYSSNRYCLGTENASRERLDEISRGIRDGDLIGMPVWAYVHSGSTIRAAYSNPFSCPWDSGQSGFVYTTKAKAIAEFGKKTLTKPVREKSLKCLKAEVETFAQYLEGDIWGYVIEELVDGEWSGRDSCWGMYGYAYCLEEAKSVAETHKERMAWEAKEAAYWLERGIPTTQGDCLFAGA